ncbi:MAG: hypothetical protein A4S17_03065 [Proteobacteria bacterium HN_bin10]|jgi:hypothetical protein|nr:MAG: hypothetical protein A4S17_03065 [Proteobacteria bacterium HN_bin10]
MRRFLIGVGLIVALAACGQQTMTSEEAPAAGEMGGMADMERAVAAEEAPAPAAPVDATTAPANAPQGPSQPAGPAPVLYLAYSYAIGLEIPSERLASVMDRHIQACQAAGPRLCQLIGSNRSGDPESYMEGYVSLRGEPSWLNTFKSGMEQEADAAGGRVISETTNSEDLTRQIVDTEARLRAQTALRDRLQELLRSRPGRLADLLEVERELARVQAEIDSVQSALAVMRTRVAMSELNLQYRSAPRPVGSDTFEPLRQAFANFLGIVVAGFAAIITIIAGLIPVAVVVVPLVWLLLRWRRARGGRFFRREPKPEATANEG